MLFSQLTLIDEYSSKPCENGGKCCCVTGFIGDTCESKFSVILYNMTYAKVKEDLQNNIISTNKVDIIKVHNDQFSPVTCRLLWKSHMK